MNKRVLYGKRFLAVNGNEYLCDRDPNHTGLCAHQVTNRLQHTDERWIQQKVQE